MTNRLRRNRDVAPAPPLMQQQTAVKLRTTLALIYVRTATPNRRAAARQRALTARAKQFGWPPHRIRIIDTDVGRSGLSERRPGFRRMTRMVEAGRVGLIVVEDLSRLSRDPAQLTALLEKARRAGTLIAEGGHIHDLANRPTLAHRAVRKMEKVVAVRAALRGRVTARTKPKGRGEEGTR